MITLYVQQVTLIQGYSVPSLSDIQATWEGTIRMDAKEIKNKRGTELAALNPKGASIVNVAYEEKIAGPVNTFSSVAVRVEISTQCDPADIKKCHQLLFDEASNAVDHYIQPALSLLMTHLDKRD